MTIKGSLQASIPIVKPFSREISCPVENWRKICWGKIASKCKILLPDPPNGISLHETTSFDVLIVKIGAGVLAVG